MNILPSWLFIEGVRFQKNYVHSVFILNGISFNYHDLLPSLYYPDWADAQAFLNF